MILTCSQCDARYEVDSQALVPNGRTVRCAKCGHVWTERPPESQGFVLDADEPAVAPNSTEPAGFSEPAEVQPEEDHEFEARLLRRQHAAHLREEATRKRNAAIGWAALVVIIVAILGAGIFARNQIVAFWPPAASLYQTVGLPIIIDFGLDVKVTKLNQRRDDNDAILIDVTGEITNTSEDTKVVPEMLGELLDVRRRVIHSWTFSASSVELQPGESAEFTTTITAPPRGARQVNVTFVIEG